MSRSEKPLWCRKCKHYCGYGDCIIVGWINRNWPSKKGRRGMRERFEKMTQEEVLSECDRIVQKDFE